MKHKTEKVPVRASRLRVVSDLIFVMAMLFLAILIVLAALLGLLYWTKVDLGIDLFEQHISDLTG